MLDQATMGRPPNEEIKQVRAHLAEVADAMKRALLGLPPPVQTPEVQKLTDKPCQELRQAMTRTVYKGTPSESRNGSDAIVATLWRDATGRGTETLTLDFKLKRAGNHWKVVAIPNLTKVMK